MSLNTILATAPLTTTNYVIKATGTALGNSIIFDNGTNVGIGNTNTSYTLDVSGTGRFTGIVTFGSTLSNGTYAYTLPSATGTLALTSALGDYLPLAGGTLTGALGGTSATFSGELSVTSGLLSISGSGGTPPTSGVGLRFVSNRLLIYGGSTDITFQKNSNASANMIILEGGDVGIGTSSPTAKLDVNGEIRMTGSTLFRGMSSNTLQLCGGTSSSNVLIDGSAEVISMSTNGGERMRITSGGNVGIGLTSPSAKLEVNQSASAIWSTIVRIAPSTGACYGVLSTIQNQSPNNTSSFLYYGDDNTVGRFIVYSNGGIANYQANNVNLSDGRTKKDILPLESYWDKFKAIVIVKFKYKDQTHDDYNIGVIAQQVESVAPEFIDIDGFGETPEDGIPLKTVYTSDLHHATIKVLQEAMTKIEEQQIQIQNLQEQINILAK